MCLGKNIRNPQTKFASQSKILDQYRKLSTTNNECFQVGKQISWLLQHVEKNNKINDFLRWWVFMKLMQFSVNHCDSTNKWAVFDSFSKTKLLPKDRLLILYNYLPQKFAWSCKIKSGFDITTTVFLWKNCFQSTPCSKHQTKN